MAADVPQPVTDPFVTPTQMADSLDDDAGWFISAGVGATVEPDDGGSGDIEFGPLGFVELGWRSSHPWGYGFALGLDGLTVDVYSTDRFGLSLGAGYDFGRDADDDKRFKGLGDIDGAVTGEIGITYAPFEFLELGLGAARYFGGSDGTLVTFGAGTGLPLGERAFVGLGVGATWADDAYMDAYYSVTPTQLSNALAKGNTTKGLKVFDAGAGIQSLDASLEVGYQISERWSIGAEVGVTQFVGDAADSPLVEEELQPNAGLMLVWQF